MQTQVRAQPTKVAVCVRTKRGEGISSGVGRRRLQSYMSEGGGFADLNECAPLERRVRRIFGECCTRSDFVIPT